MPSIRHPTRQKWTNQPAAVKRSLLKPLFACHWRCFARWFKYMQGIANICWQRIVKKKTVNRGLVIPKIVMHQASPWHIAKLMSCFVVREPSNNISFSPAKPFAFSHTHWDNFSLNWEAQLNRCFFCSWITMFWLFVNPNNFDTMQYKAHVITILPV